MNEGDSGGRSIGLTRVVSLIIGLKPVDPLALIEEARARVKNHG